MAWWQNPYKSKYLTQVNKHIEGPAHALARPSPNGPCGHADAPPRTGSGLPWTEEYSSACEPSDGAALLAEENASATGLFVSPSTSLMLQLMRASRRSSRFPPCCDLISRRSVVVVACGPDHRSNILGPLASPQHPSCDLHTCSDVLPATLTVGSTRLLQVKI